MRQKETLSRQYFEDLYAASADPWQFETSKYEQQKYQATLDAVGSGHGDALEIGCAIGIFTRLLSIRYRSVLAIDIAETALAIARRRCADRPNVEFRQLQLPDHLPDGRFDLIILSEVGYYWTMKDLSVFTKWLQGALRPSGLCALVHWTGETDYPLTADQVHDYVGQAVRPDLQQRFSKREALYRLDVLAKT
jgi:2-polyprenyl-3-methyl-5-hydroxy-6-metoxy-1,4-benzoquinol methylase